MNFRARVIAAVMIVTVSVAAFQGGSPPTASAQTPATPTTTIATSILTGALSAMGKGVVSETTKQATDWALGMLGFDPTGGSTDPQLAAIQQTLDQILATEITISNDLKTLSCVTWQAAIVDKIGNIEANWATYQQLSPEPGSTPPNPEFVDGFLTDVLGTTGTGLPIKNDLSTIYAAVFPSSGPGVVDTCLTAAVASDPPGTYELDNIWYDKYVVPLQNSLMLEYTRAMLMVVNAYHEEAVALARTNGMPDGDFATRANEICSGKYDTPTDPAETSKPSGYCNQANSFVAVYMPQLRRVLSRGGAPYTHSHIVYYTDTGYLLPRSLDQYGLNTVGTYDQRLPNGSGFDGYHGEWVAAPAQVFNQILKGWKDLGGKDNTALGYWLCHGVSKNDTSVSASDPCTGLSMQGMTDKIIIFPDDPGKNSDLQTKFVCFMDGSIPRDLVEGQPFCKDHGYGPGPLWTKTGECHRSAAFKQKAWTQQLPDPSFYALDYEFSGSHKAWCTEPGYINLSIQKPRWPAYSLDQITCYAAYPATNPAGLLSRCGDDMEEFLNSVAPMPSP